MTRDTEKCPLSLLPMSVAVDFRENIRTFRLDNLNCQLCAGVHRVGLNCILTVSQL